MKFTWYGKENAIIESMTPSTGTLRPDKESSKNWDDTENLYIEGDNLEVLKLLQKSYFGKVKMIYIDPPYNTGKDFVYKDNFRDNIANYKEITNQTTKANPETNGRYHTDWLNMMYPRLKLARNLLRDDGVIFISIDDNEIENLKKCCNEIFGETNFIANAIVEKSTNGMGDKKGFSKNHEFLLCYQKTSRTNFRGLSPDEQYKKLFDKEDEYGKYKVDGILMKKGAGSRRIDSPTLYYPLYYNIHTGRVFLENGEGLIERYPIKSDGTEGRWTWGKEKVNKENYRLYASDNGTIYIKDYLTSDRRMKVKTILRNSGYLTERATNEIKDIFNGKFFDTPKPITLIEHLIDMCTYSDDLILDFFSGSATTAHSIFKLNKVNTCNRKFIMVQLPEQTDEKSEAYKAGYKNICEIGKERIRRAGDKIVSENKDKEGIENLDIGFKVFKLEYNCGGENHSMMEEGIRVDIIKRPKDKPICKFKVDGELYYLVKTNEDIIVFPYKSSIKGKAIASIFNIELCKDKDYMQLEYLYNMKLNEFNGEDFAHSQYVTSVILDNVYKNLNE